MTMDTLDQDSKRNSSTTRILDWVARNVKLDRAIYVILIPVVCFLTFYNLGINPRPWHDEGGALSLAKTIAVDGVYSVKTSDGYQSFGPVQSVGPTIILPIALSFKSFGVGLIQGRLIAAIYLLLTLVIFYLCGKVLWGHGTSTLGLIILLCSPAAMIFLYGREVLGEVPSLGFFLAAWYAWAQGIRKDKKWLYVVSGLLLGLAIVTKSQYLIMGMATLGILVILDLLYYRQGNVRYLIMIGAIAVGCLAAWYGWQYFYFGSATFIENFNKLGQLAKNTSGINLGLTFQALQFIFGTGTGNFYLFTGFLGIAYIVFLCLPKTKASFTLSFLLIFACVWIAYFIIWIIPWPHYMLAPSVIVIFFISKLFYDVLVGLRSSFREFFSDLFSSSRKALNLSPQKLLVLGSIVAVFSFGLWLGYEFQNNIRENVLDKPNSADTALTEVTDAKLNGPIQTAAFIRDSIDKNAVIDTWERELDILVDRNFHFPDQSLLANVHYATYRGGPRDYYLGADYFSKVRPDYVIIGWYEREAHVYDYDYLGAHGKIIKTIGSGVWSYEIYKMDQNSW